MVLDASPRWAYSVQSDLRLVGCRHEASAGGLRESQFEGHVQCPSLPAAKTTPAAYLSIPKSMAISLTGKTFQMIALQHFNNGLLRSGHLLGLLWIIFRHGSCSVFNTVYTSYSHSVFVKIQSVFRISEGRVRPWLVKSCPAPLMRCWIIVDDICWCAR